MLFLIPIAGFSQIEVYVDTMKKDSPNESWNVNKRYDKDGNIIAASDATIPSDRLFRGAWTLSGSTITEDLTEAKKIFQAKIREVRKPLLEAEDVTYMKALEAGDTDAQAASVATKKKLRDAPAASAISSADSIAKLKAAWDKVVLGDSPYA